MANLLAPFQHAVGFGSRETGSPVLWIVVSVDTRREQVYHAGVGTNETKTDDSESPELAKVYYQAANGPRGPHSAAFFDLDKTILAKSSTLALTKEFYKDGLIKRADAIKAAYGQLVYTISGADDTQMEEAAAYMSELVKGWPIQRVREIVAEALDSIVEPIIYAEAEELIRIHHDAGRRVVIVSSSGTEVVEPIGQRLGADIVIGTQMAIEDGEYTGEILFYAYGENKAQAMADLAREQSFDLDRCFAYSDSHTDLPMLEMVAYPVVTNPDSELREIAEDRGWPQVRFRKPVALKRSLNSKEGKTVAAVAVGSAVALGLAWYAARRSG